MIWTLLNSNPLSSRLVKGEWPFSFRLVSVCFDSAKVQIFRTLSVRVHTFSLLTLSLTWLSCYDFRLVLVMILRTWLYDWWVPPVFVILLLFIWTLMVWCWHDPFDNLSWPQPLNPWGTLNVLWDIITGGEISFLKIMTWKHLKEKLFYNDTFNMI